MSRAGLERRNTEDFTNVLRQPAGARLIAGLIDFCGLFADSPKEGARDVGLMLYRFVLSIEGGEAAYIGGRDECKTILEKGVKEDG